jgi:hypothetical protein
VAACRIAANPPIVFRTLNRPEVLATTLAAIVSKLFGVRYLATLFGLTLLSHQIGGFLGAWLGGLAVTRFGDFGWMWYADMALAAAAAAVNLPIRESPVPRTMATA